MDRARCELRAQPTAVFGLASGKWSDGEHGHGKALRARTGAERTHAGCRALGIGCWGSRFSTLRPPPACSGRRLKGPTGAVDIARGTPFRVSVPNPSLASRGSRAAAAAAFVVALLAAALLCGACGGGGGSDDKPPSASQTTVDVTPGAGVVANGVDSALITVTVRDAQGKALAWQPVVLAASGQQNTLVPLDDETDATGVVQATLASLTAQTKTITAWVGAAAIQVGAAPTVAFIGDAGALSAALSSATATPSAGVVADGVDAATITVTVRDVNGNAVADQLVEVASSGSDNVLVQPAGPTDAAGVATATLASTRAQTKTLSVVVNPGASQVALADAPTVAFVGDPSTLSAALSSLAAAPGVDVVADGTTTSTLTITVRDAHGNPVAGQTVQVAASGSANTLVQPAVATNSAGVATATLATTVAETKTLSAIVNPGSGDLLLDDAPTVAFIGDASAIDPALSSVDAAPLDDVVANGTDASTVTVTVRDIHGNPVPGQLVELAASGSGNAIAQPASPTDAAGVATAALAATKAEVKTLLATVNPGPGAVALADQPSVEFIADASQISAALSSASATPGAGLVANGTDASTITAVVRDVHGNAVPGQTVAVASSGSGNTLVQPGATTDASGAASATIASTVAELKHVTLTINPGPNQVVLAAQPIAEFVADLSDLSAVLSSVSVAPGTDVIANGSDASSISVTVRDANGNLVAGQIVQLAASGAGNTLVQPASPTNASGIATGSLASTIAGAKTLTVTINPGPAQLVLTSQPDVVFVGDPSAISAALSSASAAPSADVVADGTTSSTITVAVRDVNGNPVAGQVVQLAASGASNTLGQPAAVTNALGVAVGTLASTHAETKTLAITVNPGAGQIVLADAPTVAFVGDPSAISASLSSASAAPSTDVVADGATASTITVTVRDAHGNAVAGQAVQLAASGAGNTLVQPAAVTDAFGVATGTLASTHAEAKTLTATVNPGASQVVLADAPTVAFVGDPSTISASLSSASAVPSSDVVADGATASTITVTVRDVNGNPVAGQVVELAATGTNNTLAQPAVATDALGVAAGTLASTHAEVKTLTVTVNPGAGQVVLADAPTVAFVGDPSTISAALSSASAAPSTDVVADGTTSSTITVTVRDANGNAVAGQTVQLASSGTNNSLAQPAAVTNALGVAVGALASTRAETKTLTVTVNPGAGQVVLADAPAVAFVGDPSTISALLSSASASPSSNVVADGTTSTTITVTVRDANGNAVAGQTVQLASSGTNNTLVQPAAVTNALGVATGTLASTKAETKTLGATVNPGAGQVVLADAPTVGFVGDPSTISAALSSASAAPGSDVVADGTTASTITVTVRDANGNAVAGQTVQLASSGTSNALVQPAAVTNGLGVATGTLASTHAETKALTATVNPGAGQVVLADAPTVAFVGDPSAISAALSSVAAAPGSGIVADGTDAAAITVTVRDVNGNAVAGQTVQLAATGTGNTLVQPAAVTSAAGIATGSLASTVAATKAITAIVNPGAGQVALSDAPTAAFVADASSISAALSSVSASPTSGVAADGSTASTITITVRDANGNAVAGQTVQLAATGTGNSLAQPAAVTNTSGVATGALAATIAETKTLTATVNPGAGQVVLASTPTVVFTGDPNAISAALSTIEADPDFGARANGSDAVTVTVTVRDANGNPVAAQSVQLTATGSGNALSQPASATDLAGQTSGTLKTTIAELKTLTALIDPGGAGIAVAASATAEFVWPAPTRRFVRVTGSDANDGLSAQSAWRTLGMAALSVSAGQTVHVGAGTYAESVVIAGSGTQADPIAFLADETGEYTGDAGEVLVDAQDALAAFTLDSIDDVEVTGFTVTGALAGSGVGFRVGPGTTHRVKLRRNQIYSNGIGIQAQNAIDLLLEHNRISRSRRVIGDIAGSTSDGGHGVVLDGGSSATLRNNLLYANEGSGLWITGGVLGATVQSNTFYANESDQLFVD
ncbi:MAG: hypothetical protein EPO68_05125, partial [Planctomycetota bacterium]